MDIQLYKEGNTHTVRGVPCELCNFHIEDMESALKDGWYRKPGEWLKEAKSETQEEQKEMPKSDPNHPVRQAAKEADIDGWDSKRISTLEKELNGTQE